MAKKFRAGFRGEMRGLRNRGVESSGSRLVSVQIIEALKISTTLDPQKITLALRSVHVNNQIIRKRKTVASSCFT